MGRRSINTTKSGKYMNPTDQFRKEARKRELKKNKKQRIMVRTAVLKGKDPMKLLEEMEIIDRMEYDPMQPPSLNEKVLREKRKKLRETFDRVFKLYEKERPEYALDLKKANIEYEKTRSELQLFYDQVRNAERVQLDQIPLPDAPGELSVPGAIPLPIEMPMLIPGMPMPMGVGVAPPPSILKKTSAYGPQMAIGPHVTIRIESKKKRPPGPPPGDPPILSETEEEMEDVEDEYDPEKGIVDNIGTVDVDVEHPDDIMESMQEASAKSRRIRFADDDNEDMDEDESKLSDDEIEQRARRRAERKDRKEAKRKKKEADKAAKNDSGKKKVSALQAMMLKMAGQDTPDFEKESESSSESSSSSSSSSGSEDEEDRRRKDRLIERREEDERIRSKDREIARKREEISRLDDRPPGIDDPIDRLSEADAAALIAARLAEEAEREAESFQAPPKIPPGPPPGLPLGIAGGPQGLPPGPPPGAPPMFLRPPPLRGGPPGAPPRLMPPGPPPGRPQGMPPGPPPGLPPNLRVPPLRIPAPIGVPPPRMMRPPGGLPSMLPPSIPPPQGQLPLGALSNPNILSAPPSILRPRDSEDRASGSGQSRVTIQAKPQIKTKMGDVTRFMPTALKVKREIRDQKGRLRQTGKEEETRVIGAQAKPQPAPAAQAKTKDDAYDQFMKEMEGLI